MKSVARQSASRHEIAQHNTLMSSENRTESQFLCTLSCDAATKHMLLRVGLSFVVYWELRYVLSVDVCVCVWRMAIAKF